MKEGSVSLSSANAWVTKLFNPAVWPHPVKGLRCIQTHISLIILTGDYAYKLKKPVNLGFLDFSSLAQRRHFCEEELRLNRRLAPQLYLCVIPIGGSPLSPLPGSTEKVFEYAVKMRQFPQSAQLDNRLSAGVLTLHQLHAVADLVANFHKSAEVCKGAGSAETVLVPFRDNLNVLQGSPGAWQTQPQLAALQRWLEVNQARLAEIFESRRAEGFVRDGHGDLHLRNLAWIDGEAVAFDCIEFDPELRRIDVMNDIAFAVMDLHFRQKPQYALQLLNRYLETSGDYAGLVTMDFYLAYRATVRAKIDAIRADQEADDLAVADCWAAVRSHLALAEWFVRKRTPMLIITRGMSGSGKSHCSAQLLGCLDAIRIRSDVERKRLAGLSAQDKAGENWGEGLYSAQNTVATYQRLADLAEVIIAAGRTVIVDATFAKTSERTRFQALAQQLKVPFRILEFSAPPELLRERVQCRSGDPSDANLSVLENQLKRWRPLQPQECDFAIEIDSGIDFDPAVTSALLNRSSAVVNRLKRFPVD